MTLKRKRQITPDAARLRMADLCARAEHCEYEIDEKLRKMGLLKSDREKIIEYLMAEKFLDNHRYALSFANDKVKFSAWGKNKIRQGLALKRISSHDIADALKNIDGKEYLKAIQRAGSLKAKNLDLESYEDRGRLHRYLLGKGFESDLISKLISFLRKRSAD